MSWSVDGSIRRPFEVSALLPHTREVMGELLATDEIPELESNAPTVAIETMGMDIDFTVLLPTGDGAEVRTVDLLDGEAETTFVVVSSRHYRATTNVSTVLCIAVALAAADLGGGSYFDDNRGFVLRAGMYDPHEFIARTRLAPSDLTFAERCERYLAPR
ncbi:hypothetical protein [Lentzea sp. NPDC051838]|uniref:hypothetical protein n=1 Tax=Lentzea sp. NPDC051838 TaxID=3154849 RepID=UPI0034181315